MDPITAVNLAGTIIQFIELGAKVTSRVADFSSAVDGVPRAFKQIRTELPLILDGLRRIQRNIDNGLTDKEAQEALMPVVRGCLAETQQLDKVIEKALPSSCDTFWERKIKAIKSLAYDQRIEEIAESLDSYTKTLIFHQVIENFNNFKYEQQQPPCPDPLWVVPFDRNPAFAGRDGIFAEIDQAFAVQGGKSAKGSSLWSRRYRENPSSIRILLPETL
ncbi:uncharacterized protein TrAtP1_009450 [Trichoderma atroviride]|uniref:uncharacterized protein n=1 Tax=Hypocrea atroviridis TaxID=63577 RepID=UPI003333DCA8|nr:hypothetical protein TrAtP1_009450 [Trichoderma atroviride]